MNGPDIFTIPLVGGFVLLIIASIFILFIVRLMPYMLKDEKWKVFGLMKLLVIFMPLIFAIGELLNYVSFDLVGWINFEIIALSGIYMLELIVKHIGVMKR